MKVEQPEIRIPNRNHDFGAGFYVTANEEQAIKYAQIVYNRQGGIATVSCYEFDYEEAKKSLNIKSFDSPDGEWLPFAMKKRYHLLNLFQAGRLPLMDSLQFKSLLQIYTPCVIKEIMNRKSVDEKTAIEMFYTSSLYEKYTDEKTKLWHFSPVLLVDLLTQEQETGEISYPIEGSGVLNHEAYGFYRVLLGGIPQREKINGQAGHYSL
jgi:hypothetical protein